MGQYKSRPATGSVQELWRDECAKLYRSVILQTTAVSPTLRKRSSRRRQSSSAAAATSTDGSEGSGAPETEDSDCGGDVLERGWTELHLAAFGEEVPPEWRDSTTVWSADRQSMINAATIESGLTPLHVASTRASEGHAKLVTELLRRGADAGVQCRKGLYAIHYAAVNRCAASVRTLAAAGCPLLSAQGTTPFHLAALCGYVAEVSALLEAKLESVAAILEAPDENGFTALHLAAWFGHLEICAQLLAAGATVDCRSAAGETPLQLAVCRSHCEVAELLLRDGAAVDAQDEEGNSAVHNCCRRGDVRILELLLEYGSGVSSLGLTNLYLDSPLHTACYAGRVEILTYVLGNPHLDVRTVLKEENVFSETTLHAAATCGRSPLLVATLLQHSMEVNTQGRDGHTPLHSACWNGNLEVANILLVNGADIRIKTNDEGETCIMWCHRKGFDSLLEILELHAIRMVQDLQNAGTPLDALETEGFEDLFAELTGLPKPSPLGRIRKSLKKKVDVTVLKNLLPPRLQVQLKDIELIDQIAQGSFGKVYRASYHGQVVAVKKYRQDHMHAKSNLEMFCREVSILAKLDHPCILRLVGAVTTDPSKFAILTEFVDGSNLYDTLHEKRVSFDFTTRVKIARGVASGMAYMHGLPKPIIHRDLNSHNVLLFSTLQPVIADFGESRFFNDGRARPEAKDLTLQPGNLRWMAPEIFVQNSVYTVLADVYSYALLLWELLTGHIPFAELKAASAAFQMAHLNQRPTIPGTCPPPIASLLRRAWSSEAHARPAFRDITAWFDLMYASHIDDADVVDAETATRLEVFFAASHIDAAAATDENSRGYVVHAGAAAAPAVPPQLKRLPPQNRK
mmetsp:Transcript_5739/g.17271  ORF Transcript_5739/g.17271 Transcript_5739/m.17271 type:complete len:857 (-) Transcript_5739:659-3229(-)